MFFVCSSRRITSMTEVLRTARGAAAPPCAAAVLVGPSSIRGV